MDLFLYRIVRNLSADQVTKEFLKEIIPPLAKVRIYAYICIILYYILQHTSDSDPEVRDSSYAALGAFMKCVGEKPLTTLIGSELASDKSKFHKVYTVALKSSFLSNLHFSRQLSTKNVPQRKANRKRMRVERKFHNKIQSNAKKRMCSNAKNYQIQLTNVWERLKSLPIYLNLSIY